MRRQLLGDPPRRLPHRAAVGGTWEEILNTDAQSYTGSGVGNLGAVEAHPDGHQGQPASATIVVPPLATIYLRKA